MAKEKGPVVEFEQATKRIKNHFGVEGDFFVKPLLDFEWAVKDNEDFAFLSYWTNEGKKVDAVIVKKGGDPMIYKTKEYTMVVVLN